LSVVWPQNHWDGFGDLSLKITAIVSWLWPQNWCLQFGDLGPKITTIVSWFEPQNHVGYGLLVALQNRWEDEDGVGHASGSSGLLRLEASQARVSQSCLEIGGGAAWMVHVTSSRRSRGSEAKDGRFDGVGCGAVHVRPNYPDLAVILFLAHRGILVFCFYYK
jgi:hypothetical protein